MSVYPSKIDSDVELPMVSNNISEIGGDAINALRDAVFNLENEVGIGGSGTAGSIANRLSISLDSLGNIKPSALTGLGLVVLPITNSQVSATAGIQESKLALDHKTTDLLNLINSTNNIAIQSSLFVSNHGYKIEPHIDGSGFRHVMNEIDIATNSLSYFKNKLGLFRDNTNLFNLFSDVNNDLISHEIANNAPVTITSNGTITSGGTAPPTNYGHVASGIYLNTSNFSFVPQTSTDLQQFAQFIDNSNIFILGTRIQSLYQNGISRSSRSASLSNTERGKSIIPSTNAVSYLIYGNSSTPVDNIDHGDDVIEFLPPASSIANSTFDTLFAQVRAGDVITVNYGSFIVPFIIKEKKYTVSGLNKRYLIRINGKNIIGTSVTASIDRSLVNTNKFGVLALGQANHQITGVLPTLTVGNPRGAEVLSIGFNPDLIDSSHYNLYLSVFPNGNPTSQVIQLPAIDISGNKGLTPGKYTLESVVENVNNAFRTPGFNNRFLAFSYQGEFGLIMTDGINNISFSIIDGVLDGTGAYSPSISNTLFPKNAIGLPGTDNIDPLGFGTNGSGVSSPTFSIIFPTYQAALTPTKIFTPLTRNNYYVNGVERERFNLEPAMSLDGYGDGFWNATIITKNILGSRVEVTYQVQADLSSSHLQIGKTITVIAGSGGSFVDSGRFFISNIQFNNCIGCGNPNAISTTNITVFDAIQSPNGVTPFASANVGTNVSLYFSSDSVGFNIENLSDNNTISPFKRNMEIYINQDGYSFSHERARLNISGSQFITNSIPLYSTTALSFINVIKVSPKLRGFYFSPITKITLQIKSYDNATGVFSGFLCKYDGVTVFNPGPTITGKKGEITRFYDQTNVEYIDLLFDINDTIPNIASTQYIDIQLFSTLSLDDEVMLLGSVQVNDQAKSIKYLKDRRQFGNVSENQLSTSALDFISAPTKLLNENGIIRGFDLISHTSGIVLSPSATIMINGGVAIVNGKIIQINNTEINIPPLFETLYPGFSTTIPVITWFLCINDKSELEFIASTDFDPNGSFASSYTGLGLDHTRIFNVSNPNNSSSNNYPIRGTYFNDLVSNLQDVTPIAVINITSTLSGSAYISIINTVSDARRYVGNGYSGLIEPFVFGSNSSFRSFDSLNTWLTQLLNFYSNTFAESNSIGAKVIIKGMNTITSQITLGGTTGFNNRVIFEGDCGGFIITTATPAGFIVGNNMEFHNLRFDYNVGISSGGYNSSNLANFAYSCLMSNINGAANVSNITIDNCHFTAPDSAHYAWISFQFNPGLSGGVNLVGNLQNIQITNCRFDSLDSLQDQNSAIVFVNNGTNTANETTSLRMINCRIDNNICNKNQMLMISSVLNGGLTQIPDAITTINCSIRGNICGAICYFNKSDTSYPSNVTNLVPGVVIDKEEGLLIANNTCLIIFTGAATGLARSGGSGTTKVADLGLHSGSVRIEDNICNWIYVSHRGQSASLVSIKDNKLTAFNSALQTIYLGPASVSAAEFNCAISVFQSTGTTFYPLISGNITDGGTYWNGSGIYTNTTSYTYTSPLFIIGNAKITNNTLSGTVASGNMLQISSNNTTDSKCLVEGNYFNRKSTSIGAYINNTSTIGTGSNDHIITNNFFDSPTIDGSSTILATNLSNGTIYCQNKNQTNYAALLFSANSPAIGPNQMVTEISPAVIADDEVRIEGTLTQPGNNLVLHAGSNGVLYNVTATIDLSNKLPSGVSIIEAKIGLASDINSATTAGASTLTASMISQDMVIGNFATGTNSILDPFWNRTNGTDAQSFSSINIVANLATLQTTAVFSDLVISGTNFVTGSNRNIVCQMFIILNLATGPINLRVSPLVVKYRW